MRIQILPLPTVVKGDDVEEPFALVVDQCKSGLYAERDAQEWAGFKEAIGARGILVTPETVEVVDPRAVSGASEIDRLADYLLKYFGDEIGEGSAVDNAIRLLGGILLRRDAAKMKAEMAFMLKSREEKPPASDLEQRLQDAGEKARQALGIDGTMGDAQDVPHAYADDEGAAPYCIVCGLAGSARAHKRLPEEGQG